MDMEKKRLEYYKKKLLTRRDELVKTITRTEEEGRQEAEGWGMIGQKD